MVGTAFFIIMNKQPKIYQGIILFIFTILAMLVFGSTLQYLYGIYGLAMTELMLLLIAVTAASVIHCDFSEAFPMKPPPVKQFFAALLLYAGVYALDLASIMLIDWFFPISGEFSESITTVGTSVSPALSIFIIAFLPAVCEETLHRGILLACFKSVRSTALLVLISGLLFGIFHLDIYRLLPTAMLGCALAYIRIKTDSLLLNMIMHFLTNLLSVISIFMPAAESTVEYTSSMLVSDVLVWTTVGIPLLTAGILLFRRMDNSKQN